MRIDRNSSQAAPARLLVVAEAGADPHRLVRLCRRHAGLGVPSVSLLVPVQLGAETTVGSAARAESLLRAATALLDSAGIRLEDIALAGDEPGFVTDLVASGGFDALLVCASREASPLLPHAVRQARRSGLPVHGDSDEGLEATSRLRRAVSRRRRRRGQRDRAP